MLPDLTGLFLFVTGLATAGVVILAIAPVTITRAVFGQTPADNLGLFLTRYVGLLVGLVGGLLVYAAYRTEMRAPALVVAIVEKARFMAAMFGSSFRQRPGVLALALADGGMAAAYTLILATSWGFPS